MAGCPAIPEWLIRGRVEDNVPITLLDYFDASLPVRSAVPKIPHALVQYKIRVPLEYQVESSVQGRDGLPG